MRPKLIKRLLLLGAVAAVALLVAAAPAFAGIVVVPDQHDFGEVEVGSTASTSIEISNDWWGSLSIYGVSIIPSGSDFTLVNSPAPGTIVPPGSALFMGVEFSPTAEGLATAVLQVQWTNGESGTSCVEFSGTGVATTPPPTIADALAFFGASVANDTLYGSGSGNSADGRLGALRNMIAQAGTYLDQGEVALAVAQLEAVLARCDGEVPPPDFVAGAAAAELHDIVEELIATLVP